METKLKRRNNTMKMAAISRIGVDWISVEVDNSDLNKENSSPDFGNLRMTTRTTVVTKAVSGQQTLKDALCKAMKTSRYAEIISKAESYRVGLQQEWEQMKTLHTEEEKAARRRERDAEQLKKEAELVEREREAGRVTLETMKRKAELELEDNLMILKELEMLSRCSPAYVHRGYQPVMVLKALKNGNIVNPLEQLGLHMKEEFLEDDDEAYF